MGKGTPRMFPFFGYKYNKLKYNEKAITYLCCSGDGNHPASSPTRQRTEGPQPGTKLCVGQL